MAKPASIKIRLNSTADTGYFYVTKKNARTKTEKLVMMKYIAFYLLELYFIIS